MYTSGKLNNFEYEVSMSLAVGQIIYLLDEKKNSVLPAMVAEHVVKQTLQGEEELYFVEVAKSKKLLDLTSFEGKHFTSSQQVKDFLYENLKNNINRIVEKTETLAESTWPDAITSPLNPVENKPKETPIPNVDENSNVLVDLGDGRVARLKN